MCGIAGSTDRRDHSRLAHMLELMVHRGPDDAGEYCDRETGVALGMRRLSILDLQGGHQPMANEDDSVWIVFNGEIYNAPQLRRRLEADGHIFRTRNSDTEVVVHLYEQRGTDLLAELNGIFAFVIYDRRRRLLFGARDRAGVKPLYYIDCNGRFAFASELKCLRALDDVSCELDPTSLSHYLSLQFVPAPATILRDVAKLPAGHSFTYHLSERRLEVRRYWQLPICPDGSVNATESIERLRVQLATAVRRQMLSDVPIACSLSGGLDSSAVVGLVAQQGGERVRTYSVGFEGSTGGGMDELPLARLVAERWGTDHHEIIVRPAQVLDDLERMIYHLDEPYGGGLPSWYVYEAVGRDCKVVLTGTGGDELFGNYQKWKAHERSPARRGLAALRQSIRWRSPGILADALRYPHGVHYHSYLPDTVKAKLLAAPPSGSGVRKTAGLLQSAWDSAGAGNPRDAVAHVDFQLQLPEEFLLVTDRFSMAHSVEARVPFLDHELIELAFTVPAAVRTRRGDPKYLAREVVRPLLPPQLLTAAKSGFVLPLTEWTRGALRPVIADHLSPAALARDGLLSPEVWRMLVEPHLAGRRDFTQQVWTLTMFQLWYRAMKDAAGGRMRRAA